MPLFSFGDRHLSNPVKKERNKDNFPELMMTTENKEKESEQMEKELTKNKRGEGGRDSKERYI